MRKRLNWLPTSFAMACAVLPAACGPSSTESHQPKQAAPAAAPAPKPPPVIDLHDNALDREGLIVQALHATTAAALGQDDRQAQRDLKGRQFSLRIRFGCPGMNDPNRSWSFDADKKVLRVKVRSDLTGDTLRVSDLLRRDYEGGVGFMIGRPWLLVSGCPKPGFGGMAAGEPTILVAQLFTDTDSRVQRPEASYELTKAMEPADAPSDGLDLVIAGRLTELSDGRPIHCAAQDGPPACIVSARIDRVAIENPVSGAVLGEWGNGAAPQ